MIKLSDYVFEYLADYGIEDVFMLSGGGCMHLVNSLGKNQRISYKCCLFEQAVSLAAGSYAQYRNSLGVGLVTTGPGGTNAVTGVAAAWTDSIPLLIISGQVKTSDISNGSVRTLGFQELDIVSVVKPITKYAVTVKESKDIRYELEKCIYHATHGRPGPVWLDIPLDIQASLIEKEKLRSYSPECSNISVPDYLDDLKRLLSVSKRPVIIAGYGIKTSGASEEFQKLITKLNIPVLLTWKAMDLMEDDCPMYFGRPGNIGQRCANFIQQNADLIISIGARLDFGQIGYDHQNFAPRAKKVIVDIDANELKKFKFSTDISLNIDAKTFIGDISKIADNSGYDYSSWIEKCRELKKKYPVRNLDYYCDRDGCSTYLLMDVFNELTDEKTVFAPGNSGACSEVFCQNYRVKKGQRIVTTNTLGSMGTGLPSAIGACVSSKESVTVCVNGDGGFQMNIQDLETVHRLNLPIKFFVLNNGGYGSIRNSQDNYFDGFYVGAESSSGVTLPETERIAYAYKIPYFKINNNAQMRDITKKVFETSGPVLCEVIVSPDEKTLPRTKSVVMGDGKMKSMPFEDLYPFLDRDEFNSVMNQFKED